MSKAKSAKKASPNWFTETMRVCGGCRAALEQGIQAQVGMCESCERFGCEEIVSVDGGYGYCIGGCK